MEGVERSQQLDDTHLHWVAEIGGSARSGTPRSPSSSRTSGSRGGDRAARQRRRRDLPPPRRRRRPGDRAARLRAGGRWSRRSATCSASSSAASKATSSGSRSSSRSAASRPARGAAPSSSDDPQEPVAIVRPAPGIVGLRCTWLPPGRREVGHSRAVTHELDVRVPRGEQLREPGASVGRAPASRDRGTSPRSRSGGQARWPSSPSPGSGWRSTPPR